MKEAEIKEGMMKLWKDTFHDSYEYIHMVFNEYFNLSLIEYEERAGRIIAGLMAIPYKFGNSKNQIKGLYLCGLSTDPTFRCQGIMGDMIERMAKRMEKSEYSFLFLIPADNGLQRYYKDRGFVNAFYRIKERFTASHDFALEHYNILRQEDERTQNIKQRYCQRLICNMISSDSRPNQDEINKIISYLSIKERSGKNLGILHELSDLSLAIDECIISGGTVFYCLNSDKTVSGVAFTYVKEETITIYSLDAENRCTYYKLLGEIKKHYPESSLVLYRYPTKSEISGLWEPFYGATIPDATSAGYIGTTECVYDKTNHSEVYGMARILNLYEILKFQAIERNNLKYSILVKNEKNGRLTRFNVKNGLINNEEKIDKEKYEKTNSIMLEREVAEILFRRPDSNSIIEEILQLPPLIGKIYLMLD